MLKYIFASSLFLLLTFASHAQIPVSGTYIYKIGFTDWNENILGQTCTVTILYDSVTIYHNGTEKHPEMKGKIIDKGIINIHLKTKQWVITHLAEDVFSTEIGGIADSPSALDFKQQIFWGIKRF